MKNKQIIRSWFCSLKECAPTRHYSVFMANFVPLTGVDGGKIGQLYQGGDFSTYINLLFQLAIAIGGILAVFMITYAGFLYMTSDVITNKEKAKTMLSNAIIGLVLLLAIWIILNLINPDMLDLTIG